MELATAVKIIKRLPEKQAPHIIAVDGFGGSGKSTIANKLSEYLADSTVVAMDDFIDKNHFYDSDWEFGFDREAVKAKALSLSNTYIIIEGISSTHPSLESTYDFSIWVDTPIDVAKSRGQLRDKGNENENKWDLWAKNDMKYFKKYHPKEKADITIINANNSTH